MPSRVTSAMHSRCASPRTPGVVLHLGPHQVFRRLAHLYHLSPTIAQPSLFCYSPLHRHLDPLLSALPQPPVPAPTLALRNVRRRRLHSHVGHIFLYLLLRSQWPAVRSALRPEGWMRPAAEASAWHRSAIANLYPNRTSLEVRKMDFAPPRAPTTPLVPSPEVHSPPLIPVGAPAPASAPASTPFAAPVIAPTPSPASASSGPVQLHPEACFSCARAEVPCEVRTEATHKSRAACRRCHRAKQRCTLSGESSGSSDCLRLLS